MNIGIANDHRGFITKQKLTKFLEKKGYNVIDYGADSTDSVDYPDYALKLCNGIKKEEIHLGIVICGTGIGMSIACNKIKGIRCAKVSDHIEAKLSRQHNDANVVALSAETSMFEIKDIVESFITTNFSNDERHQNRIEKINNLEDNN